MQFKEKLKERMEQKTPDLAITEAAVGAGITSILFFVMLKKIQAIEIIETEKKEASKDE